MKIERLSENQIRCTLNKNDLVDRELKLSELAYGTEKAKSLFRDMMTQAAFELGFEADDIPLVIEAIPVSGDCIILIVTKVDDPDELDTRFAKFSSSNLSEETADDLDIEGAEEFADYKGADEILDLFKKISEDIIVNDMTEEDEEDESTLIPVSPKAKKAFEAARKKNDAAKEQVINLSKIYTFTTLNDITTLAEVLTPHYDGQNTLYKDPKTKAYHLILWKSTHSPKEFNQICNMASEYGRQTSQNYATITYYKEHYDIIIRNNALQTLASI